MDERGRPREPRTAGDVLTVVSGVVITTAVVVMLLWGLLHAYWAFYAP